MTSRFATTLGALVALVALAGCGRGGSAFGASAPTAPASATPAVATASSPATDASSLVPLPEPPGGPRTRARITPLPGGAAIVTGGLSASGALDQVLYYDPARARFFELAPLAHARFGHEATLLAGKDGAPGNEVLVTGGYDGKQLLDSVELIRIVPSTSPNRPVSSETLELPSLPTARSDHRALLVPLGRAADGRSAPWATAGVLVTGGFVPVAGAAPAATSVALLYRVERGPDDRVVSARSVQIAQPRVARYEHTTVLLAGPDGVLGTDDDRVLVFGGVGFDPQAPGSDSAVALATLASPEVYEPALDRWSAVRAKGPLPAAARARRGHRSVAVGADAALVLGGQDATREGVLDGLELDLDPRDPGLASFIAAAPLAHARRDAEVAQLDDGRIVLAGGVDPSSGAILADAEVLAPDGRTREPAVPLGGARAQHALASLGARLLLLGGIGDPYTYGHPTAGLLLLPRR